MAQPDGEVLEWLLGRFNMALAPEVQTIKRGLLRQAAGKGGRCPVCERPTRIYRYKLSDKACRFLAELYRQPEGYYRADRLIPGDQSRDYNRLTYWGLIAGAPNDEPEKKRKSGLWAITPKGCDFIERRITIPEYVFVYYECKGVLGFWGREVLIHEFEGKHFNWREHVTGAGLHVVPDPG